LPLVAHLGAAWIPGLAPAGASREASVEISGDAVEAKPQFIHRAGLEMIRWRGVKRCHPRGEFPRRDDFDLNFGLGEEIQHRRRSLRDARN
jgi:hypothetical protein